MEEEGIVSEVVPEVVKTKPKQSNNNNDNSNNDNNNNNNNNNNNSDNSANDVYKESLKMLSGNLEATKGELRTVQSELNDARKSLIDYQGRMKALGVQSALTSEVLSSGVRTDGRYFDLLNRLFPHDRVEFDENFQPTNIATLLQETMEEWGEVLQVKDTPRPVDTSPSHNEETRKERTTLEDIRKMSREEVAKNWETVKGIVSSASKNALR